MTGPAREGEATSVQGSASGSSIEHTGSRLKLALDAGRMAVWDYDVATDRLLGSPELNLLLGYPADHELTLEDARKSYCEGERERVQAAAREALASRRYTFEVEYRICRPDLSARWMMLRAEILVDQTGAPHRVVGILLDINSRRMFEDALAKRDATIRSALRAASMAAFEYDFITHEIEASQELNVIYGYAADHRLTIEDIRKRYHPADTEKIQRVLAPGLVKQEDAFDMEFRLLMPDGSVRWVKGVGEYIRDEHGRLCNARGIVRDITEQKAWEASQTILINELNHRVKNTLAVVQSIVRQTLAGTESSGPATKLLEDRLAALAAAHDVLTRESWSGADLSDIVDDTLHAWLQAMPQRFKIAGPSVRIPARPALILALVLQELATNAAKHGALSNDAGHVSLRWSVESDLVALEWKEIDGPEVKLVHRTGFGSRMISRSMAAEPGGSAHLVFAPEGVTCKLAIPKLGGGQQA